MKTTPKWLKWWTVQRQYPLTNASLDIFHKTVKDKKLSDAEAFEIVVESQNQLKILAKLSLGTFSFRSSYGLIDGIRAFMVIEEDSIYVYTKLRLELFFYFIVTSIVAIGFYTTDSPLNDVIWQIIIVPAFLLWFRWIFRLQEKRLIRRVEDYFKLEV